MNTHTVDRNIYQSLNDTERDRIKAGLAELAVSIDDTREVYTDDSGKVIGACVYEVDETGHRYSVNGTDAVVSYVGVTP